MNEIYVSALGSGGSDRVFETEHVDGPFAWLPFCHVYRCMVGLSHNAIVTTSFPTAGLDLCLPRYGFVAFDYNRDIHAIQRKEPNVAPQGLRITLKLHYIACPAWLPRSVVRVYKALHVRYNQGMRRLFLQGQPRGGIWSTVLGHAILSGTVAYTAWYRGCLYLFPWAIS
jgi:hypothetical protein